MKIHEQLRLLQAELKAPKSQYNSFGKYKYRNAEDILEALKPLAVKHGLTFTINDTLEAIGDRFYVRAEVTCTNDDSESVSVTAYAREEENKKGMDGSQVTGASSSYARKYALNGMLLIDDTKDADSMDNSQSTPKAKAKAQPQAEDTPKDIMSMAIEYIKGQRDKKSAYEAIMAKYGEVLTDNQKAGIKKFVS